MFIPPITGRDNVFPDAPENNHIVLDAIKKLMATGFYNLIALLPTDEFKHLWGGIIIEQGIKLKILGGILSSVKLRTSDIYHTNNTALYTGPAGTGKSSLAKAVPQVASRFIRVWYGLNSVYVEVSISKIFTKWLGGSQQNVKQVFSAVKQLAADVFVFLVIDEFESLVASRDLSMNESNPLDSARVVNEFLQEIESCRTNKNIFMIFTTNLAGKIDKAVIDRMDMIIEFPPPDKQARQKIIGAVLDEFSLKLGVKIAPSQIGRIADLTDGFSGRQLAKILPLATARNLKLARTPSKLTAEDIHKTVESLRKEMAL